MKPIYVDLHIHTSEKADTPNLNYDYATLLEKVKENACGNDFLISLTDHNMINQKAYLDVKRLTPNVILGTELHIRKCDNSPAYHCHIYFKDEINEENITKINKILDVLYPVKLVNDETSEIPSIDKIISAFDEFDFLLLPHGGQSVRTFDKAIPRDGKARFDDTLERSLYYNQIDGFTARSDKGTKKTLDYFKKLGIGSFVNLVTGTDNYTPQNYPGTKVKDAGEFIPTWMYSTPTFQGLRLSLSESSRFAYQKNKPNEWFGCIGKVALTNQSVDIDVTLTPGLNVVIGGSSSGKTLFVDSIYRSIKKTMGQSEYNEFGVNALTVHNPTQIEPYYIPQNYIVNVLSDKEKDISAIELIRKIFPDDQEESELIRSSLAELKRNLASFIDKTKRIQGLQNDLRKIPTIALIVAREKGRQNFFKYIEGKRTDRDRFSLQKSKFDELYAALDNIERVLKKNPVIDDCNKEVEIIRKALIHAYLISEFEKGINSQITKSKSKIDALLQEENAEIQRKQKNREDLLNFFVEYIEEYTAFCTTKKKLSDFNVKYETKQIEISNYKLSIENMFSLKEETILDEFNKILKKSAKIENFEEISPDKLFISEFLQAQCKSYEDVTNKIYAEFEKKNKKFYRISTKDGKDFDHYSAGWKCAILLDIILKYKDDNAPIIIDQPEDNLANTYINEGLIKAIKEAKPNKQIILVSHNATIPMLGDAQNVILCRNETGIIKIRSSPLEGEIDNISVVDWVADITDGGKASIKKRVKKYNLKSFKE